MVIKNFGETGTYILNVKIDPPLKGEYIHLENNPFSAMNHQLIAPGQSYVTTVAVSENNDTTNSKLPEKIRKKIIPGYKVDKINLSPSRFKVIITLENFDKTKHYKSFDLDVASELSLETFLKNDFPTNALL
ncbi:hypothetical protein [Ligilactobacillus ruminis]|uniref:hypothetical protein n=1 Tax=Ligilactobacillus ruminis TaxID=1623 RepID=UPI0022E3E6DC|nr:hypothetical protein [Ligilactobacillus ruminis]